MFLKPGPPRKPQVLVSQAGVGLNRGAVISGKAVHAKISKTGSPLQDALPLHSVRRRTREYRSWADALEAARMKRVTFPPRDNDDHRPGFRGGGGDGHHDFFGHGGDGPPDGPHHDHIHKDNSDNGEDSGDEDDSGSADGDSDEDSGSGGDDDDDGDDNDNDGGDDGSDKNEGGGKGDGGGNNNSGAAPGLPSATPITPSQASPVNNGGDDTQSALPSPTPPPPIPTATPPTTAAAASADSNPPSSITVVTSTPLPQPPAEKTSAPSDNSPVVSDTGKSTDGNGDNGVLSSTTSVLGKTESSSPVTSSLVGVPGSSSTSSVNAGPTTVAGTSSPKQPSPNVGAIVGSVLGILVLLVAAILLFIRRRRRRLRTQQWLLFANDRQNPFETDGERNMAASTSIPRDAGNPQLTLPTLPEPRGSWFSSLARWPQPANNVEQSRFSDPTETEVESTRSTTLSFLRPTDVRDSNPSVPPYPSSSSPTRLSTGSSSASRWSFVDPFRDPPNKEQATMSVSSYPSQTLYLSGADDSRYTQADTVTSVKDQLA